MRRPDAETGERTDWNIEPVFVSGAPMAVLGPESGLGVACLAPGPQSTIVVASEGGHAAMAATFRRENVIKDYLRPQFGHVSAERVISGGGLEKL